MIFKTDGAIGTFLTKWSQTYKGKTYSTRYDRDANEGKGEYVNIVYYDLPHNFCETTRAVAGTSMFWIMTAVTFSVITSYLLLGLVEWFKLLTGIGTFLANTVETVTSKLLMVSMILDGLGFLVLCGFLLYQGIRVSALEVQEYRARRKGAIGYVPRPPSQGWINFKEGVHGVHRKFCPLVKWEESE